MFIRILAAVMIMFGHAVSYAHAIDACGDDTDLVCLQKFAHEIYKLPSNADRPDSLYSSIVKFETIYGLPALDEDAEIFPKYPHERYIKEYTWSRDPTHVRSLGGGKSYVFHHLYQLFQNNEFEEIVNFFNTEAIIINGSAKQDKAVYNTCQTAIIMLLYSQDPSLIDKLLSQGKCSAISNKFPLHDFALAYKSNFYLTKNDYMNAGKQYDKCSSAESPSVCIKQIAQKNNGCIYRRLKHQVITKSRALQEYVNTYKSKGSEANNGGNLILMLLNGAEAMDFMLSKSIDHFPDIPPPDKKKRHLFEFFVKNLDTYWPEVTDEALAEFIKRLSEKQSTENISFQYKVLFVKYAPLLHQKGYEKSAAAATKDGINGYEDLRKLYQVMHDHSLKSGVLPEFAMYIQEGHNICLNEEGKSIPKCIEDNYLHALNYMSSAERIALCVSKNKDESDWYRLCGEKAHSMSIKSILFAKPRKDLINMKINRGDFLGAVGIAKEADSDLAKSTLLAQTVSAVGLKTEGRNSALRKERSIFSKLYEEIAYKIESNVFSPQHCLYFIENTNDVPTYDFKEDVSLDANIAMVLYARCLVELPVDQFRNVLESSGLSKKQGLVKIADSLKSILLDQNVTLNHAEKLELILNTPALAPMWRKDEVEDLRKQLTRVQQGLPVINRGFTTELTLAETSPYKKRSHTSIILSKKIESDLPYWLDICTPASAEQ